MSLPRALSARDRHAKALRNDLLSSLYLRIAAGLAFSGSSGILRPSRLVGDGLGVGEGTLAGTVALLLEVLGPLSDSRGDALGL
ncbi:hypothetical protein K470DRAFT_255777 [Piedraia hortae CBS 480.64]|uniref:Uncharacterized protein n=1 Tax=Piedraia hortae CBS 480.64 TaxID=1314780 RepID=A0A6A7C4T2_9PEZI|nr:hypothetical protein K470DRAFT_255777 [Piedraia hortae CBS 480.64]